MDKHKLDLGILPVLFYKFLKGIVKKFETITDTEMYSLFVEERTIVSSNFVIFKKLWTHFECHGLFQRTVLVAAALFERTRSVHSWNAEKKVDCCKLISALFSYISARRFGTLLLKSTKPISCHTRNWWPDNLVIRWKLIDLQMTLTFRWSFLSKLLVVL